MSPQSRPEIETALSEAFMEVQSQCADADQEGFNKVEKGKWSIAENLQHLILSTQPVGKALKLPKIIFLFFGRPKKPSRTYEGLVRYYQLKLEEGAKASGRYVPKMDQKSTDKDELLERWKKTGDQLIINMNGWSERELDNHLMPHPILGKLTVREMLFFTIYHTGHHLRSIKQLI